MTTQNPFDQADLEPGGDWRCDACGGLVPDWGMYICGDCAWPTHQEADR